MNIDQYTVNRLVVCPANETVYLVTNSKTDKVSSMNCGYTCMLPNFRGACPLTLLVFSHYASVTTDRRNGLRYESVKVKKRFEVKLDISLLKDDMDNINTLRELLKKFYTLDLKAWNKEEMLTFWPRLSTLLTK